MENTTLLFELLDGTLESVREEAVFRELAANEELRHEFRQIAAMRNAVQSDTAAFIPPAESTVAIFRRLGFVPPAAPPAGFAAKFAAAAGQYSQAIIAGLTMTAVTAAAFFLLLPARQESTPTASDNSRATYQAENANPTVGNGEIKRTSSPADDVSPAEDGGKHSGNRTDARAAAPREIIRYVYVQRPESAATPPQNTPQASASNEIPQGDAAESRAAVISPAQPRTAPLLSATSLLSGGASSRRNPALLPQFTAQKTAARDETSALPAWEIGLRRLDARSVESPTIADISQSLGNNMAVTLLWRASDDWKIGAEIAREEFFQRFETTETVKDTTFCRQYEQYPSLWSAGLAAQYTVAEWGQVAAFAQGGVGLSAVGPLARLGVGLKYAPETWLSFAVRFEASGLRYSEQGIAYFSGKYGVSYGMNLSF